MKKLLLFFYLISTSLLALAQEADSIDRWDNWLIYGNKVVFGGENKWRHSHELQWRADNNLRSLEQIFYEGVFSFTPNNKWELVPDFRFAIKPSKIEVRPGFGVVRKFQLTNSSKRPGQIVIQVKYQADIAKDQFKHGIRIVPTYNKVINEKLILTGLVGPFWSYGGEIQGLQFVRAGAGTIFRFNQVHTLGIIHAFGVEIYPDNSTSWSYTPIVQLILRVNKNYKYVPAGYINF